MHCVAVQRPTDRRAGALPMSEWPTTPAPKMHAAHATLTLMSCGVVVGIVLYSCRIVIICAGSTQGDNGGRHHSFTAWRLMGRRKCFMWPHGGARASQANPYLTHKRFVVVGEGRASGTIHRQAAPHGLGSNLKRAGQQQNSTSSAPTPSCTMSWQNPCAGVITLSFQSQFSVIAKVHLVSAVGTK